MEKPRKGTVGGGNTGRVRRDHFEGAALSREETEVPGCGSVGFGEWLVGGERERGAKVKTPALILSQGQLWDGAEQSSLGGQLLHRSRPEVGARATVGAGDSLKWEWTRLVARCPVGR